MLRWPAAFDPNETKDYIRIWTAEMESIGDILDTVQFVVIDNLSGLAVAEQYIDDTARIAVVWFTANDVPTLTTYAGQTLLIDHTVTTRDGRTFNETLGLRIKEK
jgi:hypothetical protein